jgi:uncharacterized protein YciI
MTETRSRVRAAHREFIRQNKPNCRCVAGGPLVGEETGHMAGTLLVFEAPDTRSVYDFMADDPYNREEIFQIVSVWKWNYGLGPPLL